MKIKTNITLLIMVFCLSAIGFPLKAAADASLNEIISSVQSAENSVSDVTIEYTNIVRPYGSKGKELTSEEQKMVNKYPGKYKQQSGTLIIKGEKIKLDKQLYSSKSPAEQGRYITAYNGQSTTSQTIEPDKRDKGVVTKGFSHSFKLTFNPWCAMTASGDMKLSEELKEMSAVIVPGLVEVNGTQCQVVKLFKKLPGQDKNWRSYKIYLGPSRDYTLVKAEKYWYDFECLDTVMEVKEISHITGDLYIPAKALLVKYSYKTKQPVWEHEMSVVRTTYNQNVSDSAFTTTFSPGTRVWDDYARMAYTVPGIPAPE